MYVWVALGAWIASVLCVCVVRLIARRFNIVDKPGQPRKIHTKPIPLLGGVGVYAAFSLSILVLFLLSSPQGLHITDAHVSSSQIAAILIGGFFLIIGGALDDIFNFKPWQQIIWPLLAVLSVAIGGIGISVLSNPFNGGLISLGIWKDALTAIWLLTAIYTTKFLDGLDGLVSGLTAIGALVIALFSILLFVNMPTALLACMVLGVFLGFLVFNFHPATIFLGEAGSTFAGYMLGVLAILTGAKFAVALLIMGIPILDAAWVIFRRSVIERRSPFIGDRYHLHFRLLDAGFSQRQAVCIIYALAALFGASALFLQSTQKIAALGILLLCTIALGLYISKRKIRVLSEKV
ncbi:undecaprenyl/decaprenyl-phosphate alpha-N-acetylglucosaminyl 1-phosphate transferase [Candidatus Uhrbacteria bacterium]|nr:undecaprenyl/decaprenyl-phosphate alpha-N-acetylglucosaminyl 1-phosphate transferase [Candidatus Uhrbacteria bacterium]